jgi:flagellar assembly factor FliW
MSAVEMAVETMAHADAGPADLPARVTVVEPLPGLGGHTEYLLAPLVDAVGVLVLRSDDAAVRLFLADPAAFFADYSPALPDGLAARLGAASAEELRVLVVVHPADDGRGVPTANLLAPLVLAPATGRAVQVVLEADLPLRAPLA